MRHDRDFKMLKSLSQKQRSSNSRLYIYIYIYTLSQILHAGLAAASFNSRGPIYYACEGGCKRNAAHVRGYCTRDVVRVLKTLSFLLASYCNGIGIPL